MFRLVEFLYVLLSIIKYKGNVLKLAVYGCKSTQNLTKKIANVAYPAYFAQIMHHLKTNKNRVKRKTEKTEMDG